MENMLLIKFGWKLGVKIFITINFLKLAVLAQALTYYSKSPPMAKVIRSEVVLGSKEVQISKISKQEMNALCLFCVTLFMGRVWRGDLGTVN